jgi:hypothetical protein
MLPNECPHCNKSAQGIRLWWYIGSGDWLCGYCGYLYNSKYPVRHTRDDFPDDKQELIQFVRTIRPEYPTSRWVDTPRKTPVERKASSKESQIKWRKSHPEKIKQYSQGENKKMKGTGSGNRVRSK